MDHPRRFGINLVFEYRWEWRAAEPQRLKFSDSLPWPAGGRELCGLSVVGQGLSRVERPIRGDAL